MADLCAGIRRAAQPARPPAAGAASPPRRLPTGKFAETLDGARRGDSDDQLVGFARKLSREPWRMEAGDLDTLRAGGYSEQAVLHVISVVAHQNADSRLVIGLRASRT